MRIVFRRRFSQMEQAKRFLGFAQFFRYRARGNTSKRLVLEVHLLRFAVFGVVAGTGLYVAAAGWIFAREKRNNYTEVAFTDILFPWNWADFREARSEGFLRMGKAAYEEGDFQSAFRLLRPAIARYPDDIEARKYLATLFVAIKANQNARTLLQAGLGHGLETDKPAVQFLLAEYITSFDFEGAAAMLKELIDQPGVDPVIRRESQVNRLVLLLQLKRFDELAESGRSYFAEDPSFGLAKGYEAIALSRLGKQNEALRILESVAAPALTPNEQTFCLAMVSIDAKMSEEEEGRILKALNGRITGGTEKAEIIRALFDFKHESLATVAVVNFVALHRNEPNALISLANRAGGRIGPEEAELLFETVLVENANLAPAFANLVVQTAAEHEPRFLVRFVQTWERQLSQPEFEEVQWLLQLAELLQGSGGAAASNTLTNNLTAASLPVETYDAIVRLLRGANQEEAATRVAEYGAGRFPSHRELQDQHWDLTDAQTFEGLKELSIMQEQG